MSSTEQLNSIWSRLPNNEASSTTSRLSAGSPSSPRSSISSSTSPRGHAILPLPASGLHISAKATPAHRSPGSHASDLLSPATLEESPPQDEHTQAALADIFGARVRPHFRSATSPKAQHAPEPSPAPRSYFSPPPPAPRPHRPRSQSSAPAFDDPNPRPGFDTMNDANGIYSRQSGQQQSYHQAPADQHGYRPSAPGSHYSASMPAAAGGASGGFGSSSVNPISIGSSGSSQDDAARSASRPRLMHFATGSYNGGSQTFDPSGWRGPSSVGRSPSFGWEEAAEREREGRAKSRAEEYQRPWGGERSLSQTSGIGLSNMSPFTRDGGRTLAGLDDGPSMYKARRDYSLGAVGSGRKRSDSAWDGDRTLKEAAEDDEDDSAFAPPTKSGATSRRHSFAAFNPPSRSQIGFTLPETSDTTSSSRTAGSYGSNALRGGSSRGLGSSAIDDDDLAADLNSLHLNLEAHAASVEEDEQQRQQARYVGSMPITFPPSGHAQREEDTSAQRQARSPPPSSQQPPSSQPFRSPPLSASAGASRFFQPQHAQPTTSITPSAATAQRISSRFEFGGQQQQQPGALGSLALNDIGSGNGGAYNGARGQPASSTQQQAPNRYVPSFGLPPPSPPSSFYSPSANPNTMPFGAPPGSDRGLQTPTFGNFPPQQQQPFAGKPHQQQQPFYSPGPQRQHQHQQQQQQQHQQHSQPGSSPSGAGGHDQLVNLGRGVPLHSVPANKPLYIVEFKAGRKDLFYVDDPNLNLRQGDLVIVEADRGRDVGKYFKPCSLEEVQAFQQRLVEMALGQLATAGQQTGPYGQAPPPAPPNAAALARITKEFQPKKLYGKAGPGDTQMLLSKAQDEVKALQLVRTKVAQKNLPMEVCDAEWQWDRRKLTFYYTADTRVDFRELVRELFRVYKTRVWMCCLDQQSAVWDFSG